MNPLARRLLIILVAIAIAAGGIWYFTRPDPIPVTLYTVDYGTVVATVANTRVGTVKACRRAHLAPATGGQVSQLTVKEGSLVEYNQVLLEIWNQDLRAQVALATREIAENRARARQACRTAEGAEREAKRISGLRKDRLVSEEAVDVATTDAKAKRAGCEAARAKIKVSESRVAVAESAVERTIVRAPFAGVVAEVNAELGEFLTPSPPGIPTLPAIDLLDISCLYVSAPIDEVDAPAIQTGMNAYVTLDAFPKRRCTGTVRRIAPYVLEREKQARTVEVEVEITNPKDLQGLLPGYSADIEISLATRDKVLRIPTEAVLESERVFVYAETDGRLAERRFEPGLSNWDYTEVRSGLDAGEQIVVSIGAEGVEAGALVIPEKAAGKP